MLSKDSEHQPIEIMFESALRRMINYTIQLEIVFMKNIKNGYKV